MLSAVDVQRLCLCYLLAGIVAGCGAAPATEKRLEHHIPHHKPSSLAAAVVALDARLSELQTPGSIPPDVVASRRTELCDIVNWLPEIAADTDLPKAQWDEAASLTKELQQLCAKTFSRDDGIEDSVADAFRLILKRFEPLVAAAERKP